MKDWSAIAYLSCYLVIFILTWLLNILLAIGIFTSRQLFPCKSKKKLSNFISGSVSQNAQLANYYFVSSLCLSNIISVSLNPPSFILINWFYIKNTNIALLFCLYHSSMNTFLCNLAFLHVLCSSLDTFFRLKNPRLYLDSQRPQTTFLKVSAPWIVTTIQAACQLTINNQKNVTIKNSLCLINDGNFLILRSVISYAVPLVVCVILIILQIIYLRFLTSVSVANLDFLLRSYSINKITEKCESDETCQLNDFENSQSNNELNEDEEMITPAHDMENSIGMEPVNSNLHSPKLLSGNSSRILKHNCPKHGLIAFPIVIQENPQIIDLTSTSNLLMMNNERPKNSLHKSVSFEMPDITNLAKSVETIGENRNSKETNRYLSNKKTWLKMYKIEQLSIAMNMIMCIISIGVWSPLILSTLAYKLCEESPCTIHISVDRINDFEWWAFAGGLAYPCIFILVDSTIRKSLKSYLCNFTNR